MWREYHRLMGKTIVATNGCFDILHRGHVDYLNRASQRCEVLIVGLNSDESATKLKGFSPVNSQEDRAFVMAGLQAVSFVVIFDGVTANAFLDSARPNVWVKGGDYSVATLDGEEVETVKKHGGVIEIMPLVAGYSTGRTIRKMEASPAYGKDKTQKTELLESGVPRRDEAPASDNSGGAVAEPGEDAGSILRSQSSLRT